MARRRSNHDVPDPPSLSQLRQQWRRDYGHVPVDDNAQRSQYEWEDSHGSDPDEYDTGDEANNHNGMYMP